MKKNDMLNESTIRRFMKLATIGGLSDNFVADKLQESTDETVEEAAEEELEEGAEEELEESTDETVEESTDDTVEEASEETAVEEIEEPVLEDEEEMEMDVALDAPEEEPQSDVGGGMVSVDQLMAALEKALEDVLGQEVEVSQDDELEADMEADADLEEPMAGDGLEAEEEEEEEELALEGDDTKTDVVEEVYARVIQRLTKETKSNKK